MAGEGIQSIREMLRRSAAYHGDNEALVDERYRYTYAEMIDKVQRTAALLHSLGVIPSPAICSSRFACFILII